jgi:F0F1-type ATP synthase assembly protein I
VKAPETRAELIAFAFDVGLAIAVPLVIFALGGRFIDRSYGTSPLFLIIGLLISLITTGITIWKKVKHFL